MKLERWMQGLLLCALLTVPMSTALAKGGYVLVVNKRNPTKTISQAQAKSIYLGNTSRWQGVVPITLYARSKDCAAKNFYKDVLGMSPSKFFSHWAERQLSGKGVKPKSMASASELLDLVRQSPGAVGFLSSAELAGADLSGLRTVPLE